MLIWTVNLYVQWINVCPEKVSISFAFISCVILTENNINFLKQYHIRFVVYVQNHKWSNPSSILVPHTVGPISPGTILNLQVVETPQRTTTIQSNHNWYNVHGRPRIITGTTKIMSRWKYSSHISLVSRYRKNVTCKSTGRMWYGYIPYVLVYNERGSIWIWSEVNAN